MMIEHESYITEQAKANAKLAASRKNDTKDSKEFWFWLGYFEGQQSILNNSIDVRHAKDATEFDASLSKSKNRDGSISLICRVPKPIIDRLGSPSSIKFVIHGKKIIIEANEK